MFSAGNTSVIIEGMTKEEFLSAISEGLKEQFDQLKKDFQTKSPTEYLTRDEVAKMLKVSSTTIHNYTVKKVLTSHKIGRRVLYKLSEVESAIVKLNK
jgi:excisionase family DNA binding protein